MVKLLPFILIPILIVSGLGYWRFVADKENSLSFQEADQTTFEPVEVPKTLPNAPLEDRVKELENTISKVVPQLNSLKSSPVASPESSSFDSRVTNLETSVTDLKVRIAALEKATPVPVSPGTKYPLYIPLSDGGGPWTDQNWLALNEYQVSINGDDYTGYTSMQLEANFRLTESAGTGYVRLYNVTDSTSVSSELSTTSTAFGTQTSSTFKLPSGQKTYTIQTKSSQGKQLFVQSARIKVNF